MNTIVTILGYGVVVLLIALSTRRHTDADEFLMGSRRASAVLIGGALFTLVGGGELIALTALAYTNGYSALALFLGYALGFIYLASISKRIRAVPQSQRFLSLPDYMHNRFGTVAGHLVFVVSFAAFFAMLLIQFTAGGQLLSPLLHISYTGCVLIAAGIAATYLFIGGFKTVLATDVLQGIARILLLPVIIFAVARGTNHAVDTTIRTSEPLPISVWFSLTITGFFASAASSDVWQRIYAARSDRSASRGFLFGAVCIMLFGWFLVKLGILARTAGITQDADSAFVSSLSVGLPVWAQYFAVVLVLSTILGTADTEIFLLSGMLGREVSRVSGARTIDAVYREQSIKRSRAFVVLISVCAVGLSLIFTELIAIYTWLLSSILVIAPMIIASLYFDAKRSLVIASISLNLAVFMALIGLGILQPENAYWIVVPGFALYAASYFLGGAKNDKFGEKGRSDSI
ncbi:hypothetical protein P9281_27510 [Caballeronia sp. LP003]|uniref:sodium:solute symporter family protein n=1 Tax=Caballeronia sp. LP003 TaxID=3038551 RepID=UPI002855427B|nr:hypothetical protein [Caballeronia sp. LP003]MDR5790298.1 hypothetical protein [Caballeronia sp. LP003]